MKTVIFLGQTFAVPNWACFIAADNNGLVRAYEFEPVPVAQSYYSNHLNPTGSRTLVVGELNSELLPYEAC